MILFSGSGNKLSKHQTNRQIVSPSDIMRLSDLATYVRLVGGYPITQVAIEFQRRQKLANHFISRTINHSLLAEVNHLLKNAELESALSQTKSKMVSLEW